jgi:outer membrane beta-barrel protein
MRTAVLLGLLLVPSLALADDEADYGLPAGVLDEAPPKLQVIQKRRFQLEHELSFLAGVLPADPYYKGITASLGYTIHMSEAVAWEVVQGTYSFNVDTHLKDRLLEVAAGRGQASPQLPEIEWMVGTRVLLKPLYGKEALFNTEVVHLEAYLGLGPVAVKRSAPVSGIAFGVDAMAGLRLWLDTNWSLRLDIGELLYVEEGATNAGLQLRQALHMGLVIALALGVDQ